MVFRFANQVLTLCLTVAIWPVLLNAAPPPFPEYPREAERAKLLRTLQQIHPQSIKITDLEKAGFRQQKLIAIFAAQPNPNSNQSPNQNPKANPKFKVNEKTLWPILNQLGNLDEAGSLYTVGIDRALYNDESERIKWQEALLKTESDASKISSSQKYRELVTRFGRAAQGLHGDLADFARRLDESVNRTGFTEAQLPLVNRLSKLMSDIGNVANNSPVASSLGESQRITQEVMQKFIHGEFSFADASQQIESLRAKSTLAHGQYIAVTSAAWLNEAAIIRTQLAKSKGFRSWAELQVASNLRYFAPGLQTPTERIQFLHQLLDATKDSQERFFRARLKDFPGATFEELRTSQIGLLALPTGPLLTDYFPIEKVNQAWEQTMQDSGFPKSILENVNRDSFPRSGKQTHAYLMTARPRQTYELKLNAHTLDVEIPPAQDRFWHAPQLYIVQNMRADGVGDYSTAWHEGGHALDYSYREDVLGFGQDSAYAETHSMTMEKFFDDVTFLTALGRTREGKQLPKDLAETYVANAAVNNLSFVRGQASLALYDLLLWNEPYEPGGETFMERSFRIQDEIDTKYFFVHEPRVINGVDSRYGRYSTDHFYGGLVRYIGYVLADLAAKMVNKKLLDTFESKTGRRTFYQQPDLASLLANGLYRRGNLKPFPSAVEGFTGRKFDPFESSRTAKDVVDKWIEMRKPSDQKANDKQGRLDSKGRVELGGKMELRERSLKCSQAFAS